MSRIEYVGEPYRIKRRDTLPFDAILQVESTPGSNVYGPVNVTGAAVLFSLADATGLKFSGTATLVDAPNGKVRFAPTNVQTDLAPGDYRAEWQVTFASGIVQTFPGGERYMRVIVGEDLD